jgi:hypothetical protein
MSALKLDENGRLEHYVSPAPFEPQATETLTPEQEAELDRKIAELPSREHWRIDQ